MTQYAIVNTSTRQFAVGTRRVNGTIRLKEAKTPEKTYTTEQRAQKGKEALLKKLGSGENYQLSVYPVKEMSDQDRIHQLEAKLDAYRDFESEISTLGHKLGGNSRLDMAEESLERTMKKAERFDYIDRDAT